MTQDFNWPTTSQPGGLVGSQVVSALDTSTRTRFIDNVLKNSGFGSWSYGTAYEVGTETVKNGTFDSDTTNWTGAYGNCTLASVSGGVSGNCLELTATGSTFQYAIGYMYDLGVSKYYKMTFSVKSGTSGAGAFRVYVAGGSTVSGTSSGSWTAYTLYLTYFGTAATSIFVRKDTATIGTMLFDSISIKEYTPYITSGADIGPDLWGKSSTSTLYRVANDSTYSISGSFYSIKADSTAASVVLYYPYGSLNSLPWLSKFKGKTVSFGCWVWDSTGYAKVGFYIPAGGVNYYYWSESHVGDSSWRFLTVSTTVSTSATSFQVYIYKGAGNSTFWCSQPILAFAEYLGTNNIPVPTIEDISLFRGYNAFLGKTFTSGTSYHSITALHQVPVNIVKAFVNLRGYCATAGKYATIGGHLLSTTFGLKLYFPVANQQISIAGYIYFVDRPGMIQIITDDTVYLTLDILSVTVE